MPEALIWGASGGMGQAMTKVLVEKGWRVFAVARDESKIPDGTYQQYSFEAKDPFSIQEIAVDIGYESEGLDLWINMVGDLTPSLLQKMTVDDWDAVLDSNLKGAYTTFGQTVHLINQGGYAAFIGAYVDHLILPKMGAYAVAKAGLETLVAVLQKEHRKLNLALVKPGAVDTPFWENAPFKLPKNAKAPEAVANAIFDHYQNSGKGVLAL
ncbi:MAG: SDR family NAD(P)-dependent oxidoreductase [Chloroflexota bacterium]